MRDGFQLERRELMMLWRSRRNTREMKIDLLHTRRWWLNNKKYRRSLGIKPFVDIENQSLKIVHFTFIHVSVRLKEKSLSHSHDQMLPQNAGHSRSTTQSQYSNASRRPEKVPFHRIQTMSQCLLLHP